VESQNITDEQREIAEFKGKVIREFELEIRYLKKAVASSPERQKNLGS